MAVSFALAEFVVSVVWGKRIIKKKKTLNVIKIKIPAKQRLSGRKKSPLLKSLVININPLKLSVYIYPGVDRKKNTAIGRYGFHCFPRLNCSLQYQRHDITTDTLIYRG